MWIRYSFLCALLAGCVLPWPLALSAQGQARTDVLVIVDDLQSEFRATPAIRRFVGRVIEESRAAGRRVGLVTTRDGGVTAGPSSDPASLTGVVTQITGVGLARSALLQGGEPARVERSHRANFSAERVSAALASGGRLEVVLIGPGYQRSPDANITRITAAAVTAGAVVHVVDPGALLVDVSPPEPGWTALVDENRSTLSALALRTGGLAVFDDATAGVMLARLRRPQ